MCAARKGHLDVLRWCQANAAPWSSGDAYCAAVDAEQWEAAQFLRAQGCPLPKMSRKYFEQSPSEPWTVKRGSLLWRGLWEQVLEEL